MNPDLLSVKGKLSYAARFGQTKKKSALWHLQFILELLQSAEILQQNETYFFNSALYAY